MSTEHAGNSWQTFIKPFADAISKTEDEVTQALKSLVGDPTNDTIELLANEEFTPFDQIESALGGGIPKARLRQAVAKHLRGGRKPAAETAPPPPTLTPASLDVLPSVPDDEAWLRMLKTGGELKVNQTTVISGIRSALASRLGLFDVPAELVRLMEAHAESLDDPVGPEFFKLRKLLVTRNYAEIFAALGIDGRSFVSQTRKNGFVHKLDEVLWPALISFQIQLKGWSDSWQQSFGNPGAMVSVLTVAMAGGRGGIMPPGMMAPPATEGLRDAAETVNNQINRVFSGLGIPIASAMAFDAQSIKEVLETPTLPMHIGAANRDQMLKMLGVDVQADYVRLERNITRYALAIMEYPKVSGDAELSYLTSLLMLGSQIPWDKLSTTARRSTARRGALRDPNIGQSGQSGNDE